MVYARVSSADQKEDLDRQVGRVVEWATQQGYRPDEVVKEIGSGLNGNRRPVAASGGGPYGGHDSGGTPGAIEPFWVLSTWKLRWPGGEPGSSCWTKGSLKMTWCGTLPR